MTQITVRALAQAIAKRLGENGADFISETDADSTIEEMIAAWLAAKEGTMKPEVIEAAKRIEELKVLCDRAKLFPAYTWDYCVVARDIVPKLQELFETGALLASEPTQTDRETARKVWASIKDGDDVVEAFAAALASARTAAEARVRELEAALRLCRAVASGYERASERHLKIIDRALGMGGGDNG